MLEGQQRGGEATAKATLLMADVLEGQQRRRTLPMADVLEGQQRHRT